MTLLPPLLILAASAVLGIFLGLSFLRGVRKPALIGFHFLLGAAALETTAVVLHGAPNGEVATGGTLGNVVLGLLAAALLTGLATALLHAKRNVTGMMLVGHGGIGLVAFALVCVWAIRG